MTYTRIKKLAEKLDHPIFFLCNDPLWAIGLETLLPNFHIICVDNKGIIPLLRSRNISVFCLEEVVEKNSAFRNSLHLLLHPQVKKFIKQQSRGSKPFILPFKSSLALEKVCEQMEYGLLAPSSTFGQLFENKLSFARLARSYNCPIPPMEEIILDAKKTSSFPYPLVVQLPRGFAGNSTFFIKNTQQWVDITTQNTGKRAKIMPLLEGFSITVNATIHGDTIIQTPPSLQLTGIKNLTPHWGGTCGTSWSGYRELELTPKQYSLLHNGVTLVGKMLKDKGFQGIFGVDLIIDKKNQQVYVIECNPRIVASIPFFTEMELLREEMPLLLLHCASHFGIYSNITERECSRYLHTHFDESQVILRNCRNDIVYVRDTLPTGVYDEDGIPIHLKSYSFHEYVSLQRDDYKPKALVFPAGQHQAVQRGVEYARLRTNQPIVDSSLQLNPWVEKLISTLQKLIS